MTGDSTGFSTSTYIRWRDLTGNIESAKRVALKLHCLIQLSFFNILCMEFTDGAAEDAPILKRQLGMKDVEEIALNSAYLARCDMLAKMGVESIPIKPKRNATAKIRGSQAWRRFLEKYNAIRPKAETTISSVKRTIAYWLRIRKKMMQRKEGCTCIIAYNVVRAVVNPLRLI